MARTSAARIRVCVDVNVWVANLMALERGRTGTLATQVVRAVRDGRLGEIAIQAVMSSEMLGTLERVLHRAGFEASSVEGYSRSIEDLMRTGPDPFLPFAPVIGRGQLTLPDREDAGVLAAAITARADVIVTDNLPDFLTHDSLVVPTRTIASRGGQRALQAIIYERGDGVAIVTAHSADFLDWLRRGTKPTPAFVRTLLGHEHLRTSISDPDPPA